MVSYVRQRLAEIKADPALRRRPAKPLGFRNQVAEVARCLAIVGNRNRFLAVVHLIDGEKTVGELAALIGLSPSASSQHLALLTEEGIVESRAKGGPALLFLQIRSGESCRHTLRWFGQG